jgi:hypothetical protein
MDKPSRLYPKWKELLVYEEGPDSYAFECAWGINPGEVYIPSEEDWNTVVPPFLRGRREEMLKLLTEKSGHVVKIDPPRKRNT